MISARVLSTNLERCPRQRFSLLQRNRDYIVTLYLENTSSVPVGTIQASLSWTDDVQTRQVSVNAATSTNQSSSGIFSAHIKSGQSLVLDASDLTMSGQTYTVYVTAQSKALD